WKERKNIFLFLLSFVSLFLAPFFYEMGVIAVPLIATYDFLFDRDFSQKGLKKRWYYILYAVGLSIYFVLRFFSHSLWGQGDYGYNLKKLPFNIAGNLFGYSLYSILGVPFFSFYESLRNFWKNNIPVAAVILIIFAIGLIFVLRILKKVQKDTLRVISFICIF